MLRAGAKRIQELGVKPELEIFDTGHLWFASKMVEEGLIDPPPLFQLCMGIPYGAPAEPNLLQAMVQLLPKGAQWASFAIGRNQMPWVAQSVLLGGTPGSAWRTTCTRQGCQGDERPACRARRSASSRTSAPPSPARTGPASCWG